MSSDSTDNSPYKYSEVSLNNDHFYNKEQHKSRKCKGNAISSDSTDNSPYKYSEESLNNDHFYNKEQDKSRKSKGNEMSSDSTDNSPYKYSEESLNNDQFYDKEPDKSRKYKGDVTLYHGPYEAFNFIRHRNGKLRTLRGLLEKEGYFVKYVAWNHFNRMGVLVNEKLIFTCRMTDLVYDSFSNNDVSNRAFRATMEVLKRIEKWHILKHSSKPVPYDYFSCSFGY